MKDQTQLYQLGLCFIDLVGPIIARTLVRHLGSPEAVFNERKSLLSRIPGIGAERAKAIRSKSVLRKAEDELNLIRDHKIEIVFFSDDRYPGRLLHCPDAPVLLFVKGPADLNPKHMISVVGTRSHTPHGTKATQHFIKEWSTFKPAIVSGLASGIDSIAHRTALKHECTTIAVLGHGFRYIYPYQNRRLSMDILQSGALITEFPFHTKPDARNFPKRNRIVAGISDATIVMEAAEKGGALITGQLASGYQRDVFALPGRTSDTQSAGCLNLIRNNEASILTKPTDLPEALGWNAPLSGTVERQMSLPIDLSTDEAGVISSLRHGPLEIDKLSAATGKSISQLFALLTGLELRGLVVSLPGKRYEIA